MLIRKLKRTLEITSPLNFSIVKLLFLNGQQNSPLFFNYFKGLYQLHTYKALLWRSDFHHIFSAPWSSNPTSHLLKPGSLVSSSLSQLHCFLIIFPCYLISEISPPNFLFSSYSLQPQFHLLDIYLATTGDIPVLFFYGLLTNISNWVVGHITSTNLSSCVINSKYFDASFNLAEFNRTFNIRH